MTLRHLKIFTEVCRMGSITKAAENLNMAQPAISNAIRELESFYQVKLFERMNRRIYITDVGEYLLGYADSILSQFEESKDILQDIAASTRIRVGSNVSFGTNYLPEIISEFQKIHPEIPIYTMIQNSSHIEDCLLHNELDFAIVDNLSANSGIEQTLLKEDKMVALCSPDFSFLPTIMPAYPGKNAAFSYNAKPELTLSDFEKLPLLLREQGSGSRDMLDKLFHQYGIHPTIALESVSSQALVKFCLHGQGILFLPAAQAQKYIASRELLELTIKGVSLTRKYYFIYHHKKYLTKSMKYFMEYVLKC